MNNDRADRIKDLEEEIMQEKDLKSGSDVELKNRLKNATTYLDRGGNSLRTQKEIYWKHG